MTTQQIQPAANSDGRTQLAVTGAMQALTTITQPLNSQPITALTTAANQALPLTPWGALPAQGQQPLAVINPNAYQPPVVYAKPFYHNVWLMAGVIGGLGLVGLTLFKLRPGKRR